MFRFKKSQNKAQSMKCAISQSQEFGNWARSEQQQKPKCTYENYLSPKCPRMVPCHQSICLSQDVWRSLSLTPLSPVYPQLSVATDQWQNTHRSCGPSSHLRKRRTDLGLYMSEKDALDLGLIPSTSSTLPRRPHFNTLYGDQLLFSGDLWDVLASLLLPEAFYQNHLWLCGDQFSGAVT